MKEVLPSLELKTLMESLVVKVSLVLFFCNAHISGDFSSSCQLKVESTCSQSGVSISWNTKKVSKHLKQWIQSVSITQEKDDWKDKLHGSKYVEMLIGESGQDILSTIANVACRRGSSPGKPIGKVWKRPKTVKNYGQFQNGFFYGSLDSIGQRFSGDDVIFVFPDMKTVLVGKFRKGHMVAARESKIIGERCNNGIKEILVAPVNGNSPVFRYKRPNAWSIGYDYTLVDPYERRHTYIGKSGTEGDGVFAKRNIKKGELVSYFCGIIQKKPIYFSNQTTEEQ